MKWNGGWRKENMQNNMEYIEKLKRKDVTWRKERKSDMKLG